MGQVNLQKEYELYINGRWRPAASGETFETRCPANNEHLAFCAQAAESDVDDAVSAAWAAFEGWKHTTAKERACLLMKIADIIDDNKEYLSMVETLDNGKPLRETLTVDVPLSAAHFRYFAGCILAEEGSATILDGKYLSLILKEPIGVVGQIVPWNFPFLMAAWKLAPALAAGCCTVFKPSSDTPLSVLELIRLIEGLLPPGVVNIITGSGTKSGRYIINHKGLRKLAFTGSTEVGRDVAAAAAESLIPASLELGGKSANIIFEDCDFEAALDGVQMGILFNQGQVCCAGSRIFVQDTIYDRFMEEAVAAFQRVHIGLPWEKETQMGAQINPRQVARILDYVEIGKSEGATVAWGGKKCEEGLLAKGNFVHPTLLTDVSNDMRVAREEIFGPVAVVIKFHDEEEVIDMANDSPYGLGGGVWTKDIHRAFRVAQAVETGRMWVNTYNQIPEGCPFGGYKASGIGRETHKVVLDHYSQMKSILIHLDTAPSGFYPR